MKRPTIAQYRQAAIQQYHDEGRIEVDPNAKVSRDPLNTDKGAYVQAWVWVDDADTEENAHD